MCNLFITTCLIQQWKIIIQINKMKTISPIKVWFNGQEVSVSVLNALCTRDNLVNLAIFEYQLLQVIPVNNTEVVSPIVSGQLNMSGADYDSWETNEYAYDWVAQQLNLTITGEYIPPVPPEPTPEPTLEPTV